MSTNKRRTRDREKMRRRILDAAKKLFAREGVDNVSIRRIAGAIDYSPAAIYRYFGSKREILSVLRDEGFQRFVEAHKERARAIEDPLARLRASGRGYIRFALAEPEYFNLMFCTNCEQVDMEGELGDSARESFERFRANVEECVTLGHFGEAEVDTVVVALWSAVHGLSHLITTGQLLGQAENLDVDLDPFLDRILGFYVLREPSTQQPV